MTTRRLALIHPATTARATVRPGPTRSGLAVLGLALLGLPLAAACVPAPGIRPFSPALCELARQPANAPLEALMLVEIPQGSTEKTEFDPRTGRLVVDRVLPDSLGYPAAYGSFPCTLGGDGDPLDVLVITDSVLRKGTTLRVRPIAVLGMIDAGALDDKLLAVPVSSPLSEVPLEEQRRIARFFSIYKGPSADVRLTGWQGADAAAALLADAIERAGSEAASERSPRVARTPQSGERHRAADDRDGLGAVDRTP